MSVIGGENREKFTVEGLSCRSCAQTVGEVLTSVEGVKEVEVDHEAEKALVTFTDQPVDPGKLKQAVEEAGYRLIA